MSETKKNYSELKKRIADLKKQAQAEAKQFFKEESKELFETFPDLKSFGWTQYTPYFNDGDTCYFGTSKDEPFINDVSPWDGELPKVVCPECKAEYAAEGDYDNKTGDYKKITHCSKDNSKLDNSAYKSYIEMEKAVQKFLGIFDESDLEDMFGDHVKVTVTKKGVQKDDYEHD